MPALVWACVYEIDYEQFRRVAMAPVDAHAMTCTVQASLNKALMPDLQHAMPSPAPAVPPTPGGDADTSSDKNRTTILAATILAGGAVLAAVVAIVGTRPCTKEKIASMRRQHQKHETREPL
jgi:hypothetical protein